MTFYRTCIRLNVRWCAMSHPREVAPRARCACSTCRCLAVCVAFILLCLVAYVPIIVSIKPGGISEKAAKPVPLFDWGPTVDRNVSHYVRPGRNTTLLAPRRHAVDSCRPLLLIVVMSAIRSFQARDAIRQTWGARDALPADVRLHFLVGTTANGSLSDNLRAENEVHGDIVQQDFVDVYSNLTIKSVMMLKWATVNCNPSFILKVDEDMFINVPNLVSYLREDKHASPDLILGCVICNAVVVHDQFSKYYSPRYMYARPRFPMYVSGTGYVLGYRIAERIYRQVLSTPLYHLEDVFLTGMVASRLGVLPTDHAGFSYVKRKLDPCEFLRVVSAHKVSPDELREVWRQMALPDVQERCRAAEPPKPRALSKCKH
ncbi:beta-1,3-galactosyltransferase 1-like [Amphibalanus amphitrite]|uniref:beta-1,3-galactosyltransferase 1-like n=1 Tax=Amphibalanus amphitrite TaxID=1232801 RepID=UPI001C909B15|nr:beta-1,3-galactosyltransferase 1-like [Amphibalanus amphitrite]